MKIFFNSPKKCICAVPYCGKCLFLNCNDDTCKVHRLIIKCIRRRGLLEKLKIRVNKLEKGKNEKELLDLESDIESYKNEVKRLEKVLFINKK